MTDWPEAVREYEEFKKTGDEPGWDENWPYTAVEKADAAIAALKAALQRTIPRWPNVMNVRVSRELADAWWTRDAQCNRLSIEWGDADDVGFHTPVITTLYDDNPLKKAEAEVERLRWMLATLIEDFDCAEMVDAYVADLAARYEKEHPCD